ncbi:MAG: hypothetical protein M1838_001083 [Thelocarpon superellum]|nr:MAG: hypothetical protein M1838_001083 [Thelocarpon superellum]
MAAKTPLTTAGLDAHAAALEHLTNQSADLSADPKATIQKPANHPEALSWLSRIVPASTLEHLDARFHMGNYVIDRTTGEKSFEAMSIYVRLGMHLLFYGSEQEKALHWQRVKDLLRSESEKMGHQYDSPESRAHIQPFIESFQLEKTLLQLRKPNPADYATFNDFFAREILESARPIAEPENALVTSSPADCRLTAFPTIDLATTYWIKGDGFTLERLLMDPTLAQEFHGGSMVIARLAPQDYHRWHAPVSGTVEKITEVPGAYYTVNPQAINEPGTLDVFCENRRSIMTLQRASESTSSATQNRRVAIVAVGAMLVGSIRYVNGVGQVGAEFRRGQCLGAFYYGGSTVVVLYPPGEVVLDADLVHNSTKEVCETVMSVGWRTGVMT